MADGRINKCGTLFNRLAKVTFYQNANTEILNLEKRPKEGDQVFWERRRKDCHCTIASALILAFNARNFDGHRLQ